MPPIIYTDLSWSDRPRGWVRTLQVIAIAGMVGAVGGGAGALALVGMHAGLPYQQFRSDSRQASAHAASTQSAVAAQPQPATPVPAISPVAPSRPPGPSRLATASAPPAVAGVAQASAAQAQLAMKGLYDRAEPSGSDQAAANRPLASAAGTPVRAKRSGKRINKPALALRPPQGPVLSEGDGGAFGHDDWRDNYRGGNWGGGFFDQGDWRN
jgi:hypothetical protein